MTAPSLAPGLYLVATPIGNLGDVTVRALDTLAAADLIACEDTRVTRKLLGRYDIRAPVTAYHEHSREEAHRRIIAVLTDGKAVALVSDAGTPLISDPGYRLVRDARNTGFLVTPVPGPSSVVAALSAAGLPTDSFLFAGFLPAKSAARRRRLAELAGIPATLVLLESPNRLAACLSDAAVEIGGDRQATICREISKIHETFDRGRLAELAGRYAGAATKGEVVLVVAPPGEKEPAGEEDVAEQLRAALLTKGVKQAAEAVAEATGLSRRELYRKALELKEGR